MYNMLPNMVSPENLRDIIDIPRTGMTFRAEKTGWSTEKCKFLSNSCKLPSCLKESNQQIAIASRFLAFYSSGYVPTTREVSDVVLSAAALIYKDKAKTASDLIWEESMYSSEDEECGFTVIGEPPINIDNYSDNDELEGTCASTKEDSNLLQTLGVKGEPVDLTEDTTIVIETPEDRKKRLDKSSIVRTEEDVDIVSKLRSFESGSLLTFFLEASKIIRDNPLDKGFTRAHINLMRVINFLALTMLRKIISTDAQMTQAFLKEQYKRNVCSLVPCLLSTKYAPPSRACIRVLVGLSKYDRSISSFIAKLVILLIEKQEHQSNCTSIIGATVLSHLAWNGMEILHMIFEVCNHFTVSWKSILHDTLFNTTEESWRGIIAFLTKYQRKGLIDDTVAWARVIDDTYFCKFTISKHVNLASILVESLISSRGDDEILNAKWASDHSDTVQFYRAASIKLKNILSLTNVKIEAGTNSATALIPFIGTSKKANAIGNEI